MAGVWFIPDASEWAGEVGYNPLVARALERAFARLRPAGRIPGEVLACLAPIFAVGMCKSQRLRVLYVVGVCCAAEDPPTPALEPIDEALELTLELNETRAQVDLLLLRAAVNRYINQIPDAADDLRDCLQALVTLHLRDDWSDDDLLLILKATLRLAAQEFLVGAYDECQGWLDHAATLLPRVGDDPDSLGRYAWTRAQLLRWSGDYAKAFTAAAAAARHFGALDDPQNLSRIIAITGDILLDLAERNRRQGDKAAFAAYLAQAEPYIERAIAIAINSDFLASEVLARIIRARLQLLRGLPGDRRVLLEEIADMAREHQDMATACKAYTGIGRECEALHDYASAKDAYRRAIAVLKESRAVADAVWAQRALWRLEGEMAVQN
jgi:tetratricopeptide (TPR) repeat protein